MLSCAAASRVVAPFKAVALSGNSVLLISVDLPEPETPVTQVSRPRGISRSTLRRLLPRAPLGATPSSCCVACAWPAPQSSRDRTGTCPSVSPDAPLLRRAYLERRYVHHAC